MNKVDSSLKDLVVVKEPGSFIANAYRDVFKNLEFTKKNNLNCEALGEMCEKALMACTDLASQKETEMAKYYSSYDELNLAIGDLEAAVKEIDNKSIEIKAKVIPKPEAKYKAEYIWHARENARLQLNLRKVESDAIKFAEYWDTHSRQKTKKESALIKVQSKLSRHKFLRLFQPRLKKSEKYYKSFIQENYSATHSEPIRFKSEQAKKDVNAMIAKVADLRKALEKVKVDAKKADEDFVRLTREKNSELENLNAQRAEAELKIEPLRQFALVSAALKRMREEIDQYKEAIGQIREDGAKVALCEKVEDALASPGALTSLENEIKRIEKNLTLLPGEWLAGSSLEVRFMAAAYDGIDALKETQKQCNKSGGSLLRVTCDVVLSATLPADPAHGRKKTFRAAYRCSLGPSEPLFIQMHPVVTGEKLVADCLPRIKFKK